MRPAVPLCLLMLCSCASTQKVEAVRDGVIAPSLSMARDIAPAELFAREPVSDTIEVKDAQGRTMYLMKAVKDSSGEMVASDVIGAVVVSARFRNVAERHGKVDLRFDVRVPSGMVESRWQLRLSPVLRACGVETPLQPVYITGQRYRRAQLRGYQRYERFLESIISDSTVFIRRGQLEIFLRRNLPELYSLRNDSSYVSDERFASIYGITQELAVRHYTDRFRKRMNSRRAAMKDRMFARYVKAPMPEDLRLDSVLVDGEGDLYYTYSHTLRTSPGLRKAEIFLEGRLFEEDRMLCSLPETEPLTFYVSSLSGLAEDRERFLLKITERRVNADAVCLLEFAPGSSALDSTLGGNSLEMKRIRDCLKSMLDDSEFDVDSVVVAATCSPEGSWGFNSALSRRRSEAVCRWYSSLAPGDSLAFVPRAVPENWDGLRDAVAADTLISASEKERLMNLFRITDPDRRERRMASLACYRHLREDIYPHLRVVRFRFFRNRRGMVKDTVHTTVPDTVYKIGLQALRDADYKRAMTLLGPYGDINSAVAYCAMDCNATALAVLDRLPVSGRAEYLRALIHARRGEEQEAISAYMRACELDPSFVHRGNLDPEISGLKKKYITIETE